MTSSGRTALARIRPWVSNYGRHVRFTGDAIAAPITGNNMLVFYEKGAWLINFLRRQKLVNTCRIWMSLEITEVPSRERARTLIRE